MLDLFELFHVVSMLAFHFDVVLIYARLDRAVLQFLLMLWLRVCCASVSQDLPDPFADQYIISG